MGLQPHAARRPCERGNHDRCIARGHNAIPPAFPHTSRLVHRPVIDPFPSGGPVPRYHRTWRVRSIDPHDRVTGLGHRRSFDNGHRARHRGRRCPDPETTTLEQADGQAKSELDAAVAAVEEAGADISYIVLNLENGQTIGHNADRAYYSASTIKAPFCISLVRAQGDAARTNYGGLITSTIVNSDNEAYRTLRERLYGQSFFGELSAQAGAPCDLTHWYCDYSVRDLANIWRVCADWLATDDPCAQWLRDMLGDTLNSRVDDIAGIDQASTWSKAGWFSGEARYNVTFDGGVVNTPQGSYAIAVATNRGSDFKSIESVMRPLVSLANARLSEA